MSRARPEINLAKSWPRDDAIAGEERPFTRGLKRVCENFGERPFLTPDVVLSYVLPQVGKGVAE